MDISLLHRLTGSWLGFRLAIALHPSLKAATIATHLWQSFLKGDDWLKHFEKHPPRWQSCPLENALGLLPVLLFYHEDPEYLGDRLAQCQLPTGHLMVVTDLGSLFLMSQKTARPRFTSCFMSRILASLGQHFLLLYPTMFSLFGSGCSVK